MKIFSPTKSTPLIRTLCLTFLIFGGIGAANTHATPITFQFQSASGGSTGSMTAVFTVESTIIPVANFADFKSSISNSSATYTNPTTTIQFTHSDLLKAEGALELTGPMSDFLIVFEKSIDTDKFEANIATEVWVAFLPGQQFPDLGGGEWSVVPEPASVVLMVTGLLGLSLYTWWSRRTPAHQRP